MSELTRAFAARCDLLGLESVPLLLLGVDVVLLLVVAGDLASRLAGPGCPRARRLLAVGLAGLAAVVLPATALGAAGWLSNRNLVLVHAALALAAVAAAPASGLAAKLAHAAGAVARVARDAWTPLGELTRSRGWRRGRRAEGALLVAIVVVLAFYAVLAVFTLPLNYDANTYRLSRVALWLQDGSIGHLATNDPRQNFIGQNADLVMLWLVSFFARGYPLVHLAQFFAGLLACGAVYELAAQLGLARRWRLAGVVTLLGMPTATTQFFTAQTDLFVAGSLAAGLAFLLPALRGGRLADWALLGVGVGLALGAKATVLYWGPGLALWTLAWAALERGGVRAVTRGLAAALVAAAPFAAFNFLSNLREYDHPVAPKPAIARVHGSQQSLPEKFLFNASRLAWQQLDAGSNPLLPRQLREAPAAALLDFAVARADKAEIVRASAAWLELGLSEDYAAFGLLALVVAAVGSWRALARWRRTRDRQGLYVAAIAVAVVTFPVVFCALHVMTPHQLRYFCLLAPALAVLGADALAGVRSAAGRGAAWLVLAAHLATALYAGATSLHHGARALRDPRAAPWYPHWEDARAVLRQFGDVPQRVGLALPMDSWLAPFLRTGVGHHFTTVTWKQIGDASSLAELLAAAQIDALVVAPDMVRSHDKSGVWILPDSWILRTPRLAVRRLRAGEHARPAIVAAAGFSYGGWTQSKAAIRLAQWAPGRFAVQLQNPTALPRELEMRSDRELIRVAVAPGATIEPAVAVAPDDTVGLVVSPPFVPAGRGRDAGGTNELGLLVTPSTIEIEAGVDADLWTAPQASLRLVNWISGILELRVANPTPLRREVVARSGCDEARLELAPGATATLALAVLPLDRVSLAVSPEFVPAQWHAGSDDRRRLGLLLSAADLRPPAAGTFR